MQKDFQENASTRRNASSSAERWYVTYGTGVTPPAYEEGIKTTQRCGSYSVGKRASANCRQRTAGEKRQEGVSFPRKSWWGPRMSCTQQATCQFSSIFRNAEASPVLCHPSNAGTPPFHAASDLPLQLQAMQQKQGLCWRSRRSSASDRPSAPLQISVHSKGCHVTRAAFSRSTQACRPSDS